MRKRPTIWPIVWGGVALLLAWAGQTRLEGEFITEASILFGVSVCLFIIAFSRFPIRNKPLISPTARFFRSHTQPALPPNTEEFATEETEPSSRFWQRDAWKRTSWRIGMALLGLMLTGVFVWHVDVDKPEMLSWWIHIASVTLFVAAAVASDINFEPFWHALQTAPLPQLFAKIWRPIRHLWGQLTSWSFFLFLLIFLLALFLRQYRFDELPFGTWYDEAANALQAIRMMEEPEYSIIYTDAINATIHYLGLIYLAFDFVDISTQSVRLISVVMGMGTVLAAFMVGRELFGRPMGLTLAFLMAVSRWNINFSRIGMYNISTPLFELLTLGFFLRGLRRASMTEFALAGLSIGLGLYYYSAFQLFVLMFGIYLIILTLFSRGFFKQMWLGLAVMIMTSALVFTPLGLYAYENSEQYFSRTEQTSIFSDKSPEEQIPALIENAKKHLLMFNYKGDPNGRHNLPGAPMLDPYIAAFMVVGLGLSLVRITSLRTLFLPMWLVASLLGGILSLSFEAPQSLRSIGTMPVVYILAILPLHMIWQAWQRTDGRLYPRFFALPLAVLMVIIGWYNIDFYFNKQANDFASWNAFSTPETLAAELLMELDGDTDAYVISFFHGHPTLQFLARDIPAYKRLDTTDHLPLDWDVNRKAALIMNAESQSIYAEAQRYYPSGDLQEIRPPFGGPVVLSYAILDQETLGQVQGLIGTYYAGSANWDSPNPLMQQDPQLSFDWSKVAPVGEPPFSVEWNSILRVDTYGPHQFFVQAPGPTEVYIGEEQILAGTGELSTALSLAIGNHAIRVRTSVPDDDALKPFSLAWRPPDRGPELIPNNVFFLSPITNNGLLGTYYPNNNWEPPEALAQIDPKLNLYFHITPLPRPYTVEWKGKIAIPRAGEYRFGLESIDESTLFINEQQIVEGIERNVYAEGGITLESGLHDIRVRYADRTDHTHINLFWRPPGGFVQIIPSEVLFPPQGNYEKVVMPSLAQLNFDPNAPAAPTVNANMLFGNTEIVYTELNAPKGIAVSPKNHLFVADTGNKRVLILDENGSLLREIDTITIEGRVESFVEPFDVAMDHSNPDEPRAVVLDATTGRLVVLDARVETLGNHLFDVPVDTVFVERSRGIDVDPSGRIWVANTPGGRIQAITMEGEIVREIPVWPGENAQPVDVAVGADDAIYVTDMGLYKLVRFGPDGRRQLAWDIPVANSIDSAHLAVDPSTENPTPSLYVTEPEEGRVVKRDITGEAIGLWDLPPNADGSRIKPIGIDVDAQGRIWLADTVGSQVVRLMPNEE